MPFGTVLKAMQDLLSLSRNSRFIGPTRCDIKALTCVTSRLNGGATPHVDQKTWEDLEMGAVTQRVFGRCSPVGQHVAHALLRCGAAAAVGGQPADVFQETADPVHRNDDEKLLLAELRRSEVDIGGLLFCDEVYWWPSWSRHLLLLPLCVVSSALATYLISWLAVIPLAAAVFAMFAVQIRLYLPMKIWHLQRNALLQMLDFGSRSIRLQNRGGFFSKAPTQADFERLRAGFRRGAGNMHWLIEFLDLFVLHQYRQFRRQTFFLLDNVEELRRCFIAVGVAESCSDLAAHVDVCKRWCPAIKSTGTYLELCGLGTPLVELAIPVEQVKMQTRGLFVTGKNAAGKSTLLRSIGISCIFAAGYGGCFSRTAQVPMGLVATSINAADSIFDGNSLYVAELKRGKELVDICRTNPGSIIIVDELYRGTNYLESVAAAGATLRALARTAGVIATSHNVALARLLDDLLEPVCVHRADCSISLQSGVLAETNGLELFDLVVGDDALSTHARALHAVLVDGAVSGRPRRENDGIPGWL